ncbi:MAG TPA: hypothetical protein DHV15_01725 [Treponema sp.]|uniref:Uncharacterized protein n=1 Tax=Treponema denticola (strain ATCC 35405 / DSM 14222 / CIP 103919 / JCM 8153 / KCTC 15104) TaxID=243275 RepID=Q73JT8_TREDE|nr:hypothetical protein TDE_2497 [Treponema denticola ATCC 35405]HCY94222.1 hypothetical protein [Treponema sp.]
MKKLFSQIDICCKKFLWEILWLTNRTLSIILVI